MKDNRIELLRSGNVKSAVNKMAAPSMIGLLVMSLYNMVDTMFVAWIGTEATGSTQVIMPLMMLASAIGLGFGMGGGNYLSRLLGKEEYGEAEKVTAISLVSTIVSTTLFVVLVLMFFEPVLRFFGANDTIMELAKSYGSIIVVGSIILAINMTLNNLLRAEGSAKLSMVAMVTGAVLNIALDPLFIFTFGWGIQGAAIATVLSQTVTLVILLKQYFSGKTLIKINLKAYRFDTGIYKEIFKVGFPTFVRQVLYSISIGMLNTASVMYGGTDLLAATGIISRWMMLPVNVIFGLGQGFQPIAGYSIGANNKERLMESFKYTTIASTIVATVFAALFLLFGELIFDLFRATPEVIKYGMLGMNLYAFGTIFMGISNTITVFYQALGKGTEALIMSSARQGFVFIAMILILPKMYGVEGVLMTQLVSDIITVLMASLIVIPFIKSEKLNLQLEKA